MLQNYFFLNRLILEIRSLLVDSKIEEIFSQEKSKLVIVCSINQEVYHLELCVIPGNSYMNIRSNYSRAKKNTVNFFDSMIGEKICSIEIADNDRIVRISGTKSKIFFAVRGKYTNAFLVNDVSEASAFKTISEKDLNPVQKEFDKKIYLDGWNNLEIQTDYQDYSIENLKKKYPFLGNEIVKEVSARTNVAISQANHCGREWTGARRWRWFGIGVRRRDRSQRSIVRVS